jgi:methenyltetrahydrofolate cyclohydrolase
MVNQLDKELSQKRNRTRRVIADLAKKFDPDGVLEQPFAVPPDINEDIYLPADLGFLDQLASPEPTPAGGAAAAYAGACAASLVLMVARISANKSKYIPAKNHMLEMIHQAESLRLDLYRAIQEDNNAYNNYLWVNHLPPGNDEEKAHHAAELEKARIETILIPLLVAEKCLELMNLAMVCMQEGGFSTICDCNTANLLAESAVRASLNNALFNLTGSPDEEFNAHVQESISGLMAQMNNRRVLIHKAFFNRAGFETL